MNLRRINIALVSGIIALIVIGFVSWFFFLRPSAQLTSTETSTGSINLFGTQSNTNTTNSTGTTAGNNTNQSLGTVTENSQEKIFEISTGPIAGATFIQEGIPTTTIARYVMADSGHVFDLPVDVPGAVQQSVSNTTIPGIATVTWAVQPNPGSGQGSAAILQYLDSGVVKTVFLGFPAATTTATTSSPEPIQIRFLPDGITSLAVSPSGSAVAYLLQTNTGSTGYIANANGTASEALFTLPLSQVSVSWPSKNSLLVQTRSDTNAPGMALSVSTRTGAVNQLVYAQGLVAIANAAFSTIVYETTADGSRYTYAHNVATGQDTQLSFQPIPEKCTWSLNASSTLFCATPLAAVPVNYLDLWHQGLSNSPDTIFAYNTQTGASLALASPGSSDGGVAASISQIGVSPDGKYLFYITRADRSLWGVRLEQ